MSGLKHSVSIFEAVKHHRGLGTIRSLWAIGTRYCISLEVVENRDWL